MQIISDFKDSVTSIELSGHEIVTGCVDGFVRVHDLRLGRSLWGSEQREIIYESPPPLPHSTVANIGEMQCCLPHHFSLGSARCQVDQLGHPVTSASLSHDGRVLLASCISPPHRYILKCCHRL